MTPPRVYADLHNADAHGRVRLNCIGTVRDLARQQVQLRPGLVLTLYADDADAEGRCDDLEVTGVAEYSPDEQGWVAVIDWSAIRHVSEAASTNPNGGNSRPAGPAGDAAAVRERGEPG
jgi:hypothetical protein